MRKIVLISGILCILFSSFSCTEKTNKNVYKADIVIYGGTAAGVIAAYEAKRCGKSVLLIEHWN
ncbi:MAG: hypothetical protein A2X05_03705 [Bacteroidetes bacterium GWE2_41_25]|nr:MAG: hypothetical protein A2X05_03705 [Bacteroidetes bacterium GWE2_41_25]